MSKMVIPCPVCGDECNADAPFLEGYAKREVVIKAAVAWEAVNKTTPAPWLEQWPETPERRRLRAAIDALPKPPPTLIERLRQCITPDYGAGELLIEAADELERLSK